MNEPLPLSHTLFRADFTNSELRSLPSLNSGFLIASSLALNEINLWIKLHILAVNTLKRLGRSESEAVARISESQVFLTVRQVSAKIVEYFHMVEVYANQCQSRGQLDLRLFVDEATAIAATIKNEPGYLLAKWYRDKVSNHYVLTELGALVRDGNADDTHSIYFQETDGNCHYLLGESVLLRKVMSNGEIDTDAILTHSNWVSGSAHRCRQIHESFYSQLMKHYFPAKDVVVTAIDPDAYFVAYEVDSCLPIFWSPQSRFTESTE